ncbi:MAG: FKBP-type peptidyl-prolyl cis-trans isomerase [bacterium]|nr:FKBP-type peptidyl-prolyl cis-trans isomerase [bacterium]
MRISLWMLLIMPVFLVCGCSGDNDTEGDMGEATGEVNDASRAIVELLKGDGAGKQVTTTATGLQYVELKTGSGEIPNTGQKCEVHALLWLLDGTEVWDSRKPGSDGHVHTYTFNMGQGGLISGWTEGISTMKRGGLRRMALPPEIAYGEAGRSGIPGNAWLMYEIELLNITD